MQNYIYDHIYIYVYVCIYIYIYSCAHVYNNVSAYRPTFASCNSSSKSRVCLMAYDCT